MFYQTILKSVKDGLAVDVQGKQLRFVGYLPVQEGDSVWTDGTVIFGNAPPKSLPNIADDLLSGVPVLGEELRGYVNKAGKYHKKNIAEDSWIINNNKIFRHGGEDNLFDIEINLSEKKNDVVIYMAVDEENSINPMSEGKVSIYKLVADGKPEKLQTIDFKSNFHTAKNHVEAQVDDLLQDSKYYRGDEYGPAFGAGPKVDKVQVLGFKIDAEGNWDAIVASWASAAVACKGVRYSDKEPDWDEGFFYIRVSDNPNSPFDVLGRPSWAGHVHTYRYSTHNSSPIEVAWADPELNPLVRAVANQFIFLTEANTIEYYLQEYGINGVDDADEWTHPNSFYFGDKNFRFVFNIYAHYITHIRNGEVLEEIDCDTFQTFHHFIKERIKVEDSKGEKAVQSYRYEIGTRAEVRVYSVLLLDRQVTKNFQSVYMNMYRDKIPDEGFINDNKNNTFEFPLQDGYKAVMNLWQVKAIYDDKGKKICDELPVQNPQAHRIDFFGVNTENGVNSDWKLVKKQTAGGSVSQENYYSLGFYDENTIYPTYKIPNISVVKLDDEKYLIGFHKGNLYLIQKGRIKKMTESKDDSLINFRLREMKDLNKAK